MPTVRPCTTRTNRPFSRPVTAHSNCSLLTPGGCRCGGGYQSTLRFACLTLTPPEPSPLQGRCSLRVKKPQQGPRCTVSISGWFRGLSIPADWDEVSVLEDQPLRATKRFFGEVQIDQRRAWRVVSLPCLQIDFSRVHQPGVDASQ